MFLSSQHCPSRRVKRPGAFHVYGQVSMIAAHPSGLYNTRESARLIGVQPPTIRAWRAAGILAPQGLDERGYPLHSARALREADRKVRESALTKGGFDPRRTRTAGRQAEAA